MEARRIHCGMATLNLLDFVAAGDPDHGVAMRRAIDALAGESGKIMLPHGKILLSSTVFLPSGVHVCGAGMDRTMVIFRGEHPDRIDAKPRWGILRSSAFVAAGASPDDLYDDRSQELGDYYISPPRTLSGRVERGRSRVLVHDETALTGLKPGDWIHLCSGPSGWHPASSEMAQIASLDGVGIQLTAPLDNHYDSGRGGLGDYIARHDLTANPPGGALIDRWPHTGFRRLRPVEDVTLSDMSIAGLSSTPQYAVRAYALVRARRCMVRDVRLLAGWAWHVDCQEIQCRLEMRSADSGHSVGALFNGSNRVDARFISHDGSLLLEEGVQRFTLLPSTFELDWANVVIGQYCSDIRLDDVRIRNVSGFGVSVYKSRNVAISGEITAAGSAIRYETAPNSAAAGFRDVAPYFDGFSLSLERCKLRSTRNPGYDLWLAQPIRSRASQLTGPQSAPYLFPARSHAGAIVGSLIRQADGYQFGTTH